MIAPSGVTNSLLVSSNIISPVKRNWFWQKIYAFVVRNIFLPSLNLSKVELDTMKHQFRSIKYEEVTLPTVYGDHVKGIIIQDPSQPKIPSDQKWILYFCSNGDCYEQRLEEIYTLSRRLNRNIIAINYGGTGNREALKRLPEKEDLESDGDLAVQCLIKRGAAVKNMIAFGFSQGGCIALKVAEKYQEPNHEMGVVADKTFTTYVSAAEEQFKNRFYGFGNIIAKIVKYIVEKLGWTFDSWSSYLKIKGPLAIIDHPQDGMIRGPARLGQKALEQWQQELKNNPNTKKPHVILDEGFEKRVVGGNCLMTAQEYGAHVVSFMRDGNLSNAYQQLFAVVKSNF